MGVADEENGTQSLALEAVGPFFAVVMKGLKGLVGGEHYFDAFADDAIFEPGARRSERKAFQFEARQICRLPASRYFDHPPSESCARSRKGRTSQHH